MTRSLASLLVLLVPTFALADSVALKSHKRTVETVAISPDGKRFASGGDDGSVVLWEANSAAATRASEDPVDAVAFSPDGKLVAIGTQYGGVVVWDPATNKDVATGKGEGRIVRIAFMPDGKSFYTGSWDQSIRLWDTATGKQKAKLSGPKYQLYGLALSADGKQLFSCNDNGDITAWNTKTNRVGPSYNPVPKTSSSGACHAVALSADGKTLAAGYDDGTVVYLEAAGGKELRRAKVADSVNALAFAADGKLVAGTQNEELAIIDGAGAVTTLKGHGRPITSVVVARDGKHVVSGSMDMTVRVWALK
ncbi:MAG: WD40 repeat domain-containing protein [Kofleriaceae bacterium]